MDSYELGKRIAAARAYAGWERDTLADGIGMTPATLQRIETGDEALEIGDTQFWSVVQAVAATTRLPTQFFTLDFSTFPEDGPPEARLEQRIEPLLDHLERVLAHVEVVDA
jgi:transcriptional regulator with XRE-family HTH domain